MRTHAAKEVARVSSRRRVFADREASGILGPRGCVQMCMLSFLAAEVLWLVPVSQRSWVLVSS